MRGMWKWAVVAVVGVVGLGQVSGQPGGGGGFPFGGGGFGGFAQDSYSLLKNKKVQTELKVSEDQLTKLSEGVDKLVKDTLDEKQNKRLSQIVLQVKGTNAFKDPKVQKDLKFTAKQTKEINTLFADYDKEVAELKGFGDFKKRQELTKALKEHVEEVLTADQKTAYEAMCGEKFEMGGGKGPGKGGDKKPKKDDA